jgi:hypothetical protein
MTREGMLLCKSDCRMSANEYWRLAVNYRTVLLYVAVVMDSGC